MRTIIYDLSGKAKENRRIGAGEARFSGTGSCVGRLYRNIKFPRALEGRAGSIGIVNSNAHSQVMGGALIVFFGKRTNG